MTDLEKAQAQMFDAIRDFFVALTKLATSATAALEAQLEIDRQRRA